MGRWEPNARGRLEEAALELFTERGFDNVTAAEIAERSGLTERTFFRHFADKREVLFGGASEWEAAFVAPVAAAPTPVPPLEAVAAGMAAAAALLQDRREFAGRRQAIIAASAELRERELIKFASLAQALAVTLQRRGVEEPAASLTAEIALAVFRIAFVRWIANEGDLPELIQEALDQLEGLVQPGASSPVRAAG
jgi:AcrR family transcriptional regulator